MKPVITQKAWLFMAAALAWQISGPATTRCATTEAVAAPQQGMRIIVKNASVTATKPGFAGLRNSWHGPFSGTTYRRASLSEITTWQSSGGTGTGKSVDRVTASAIFDFEKMRETFRYQSQYDISCLRPNQTPYVKKERGLTRGHEEILFSRPSQPGAEWSSTASESYRETATGSPPYSLAARESRNIRAGNLWVAGVPHPSGGYTLPEPETYSGDYRMGNSVSTDAIPFWLRIPFLANGDRGPESRVSGSHGLGYYPVQASWMWRTYGFVLNGGYCDGPSSDTLMRKYPNRPGERTDHPSSGTITLSGPISQEEFIAHTFTELGSYPEQEGVWDLHSGGGGWGPIDGRTSSLYTGQQAMLADALRLFPWGRRFEYGLTTGFWKIAQLSFSGNYNETCKVEKTKYYWETDATDVTPVLWAEWFYDYSTGTHRLCRVLQWIPPAPAAGQQVRSPNYEIDPTNPATPHFGEQGFYGVAPIGIELAPDVLRVNSNFDEGRIDPVTGYAIPDCDDTEIALEADRAHLDGTYTQYQRITDDMHQGWFGVNPQSLPKSFWDGATVTIGKVDKIDDDTGHPESGQVRFYSKWGGNAFEYCAILPYEFTTLVAVNLVQGGINKKPGEGVYGSNSTIPPNARFYMEGMRPGKITLEWRLQKGSLDVKHEQTFLVATKQTKAQWKEEIRYQVRLQTKVATGTAVDLSTYEPQNRFHANVRNVQEIYYFYRQLFKQMPEKFMWAGMAKVAAAPIYAGMSDMTEWWLASETLPPWPPDGIPHRDVGVDWFIKGLLLAGQKNIFEDMAWAHRAYYASGIWALKHVEDKEGTRLTDFEAWKALDAAIADADTAAVFTANGLLLQREQEIVVQPNYDSITDLWLRQPPRLANWLVGGVTMPVNASGLANAGEWLSANANKNPIPGGPAFRAVVPAGRLDTYNDRWAWTSNATNGMLQRWNGASSAGPNFDAATRMQRNNLPMRTAAGFSSPVYSFDPDYLPTE